MTLDISRHPCFDDKARHKHGRIHLPVAPKCNIQCNFCNRKYDCANETRPGVTSAMLTPRQTLAYLTQALRIDPKIAVVGIAGPGDPFANSEATIETLRLVRERFDSLLLCVATNGLQVAPFADELAALEVSHVSLTINAVDPEIGAGIYRWVRHDKRIYRGPDGARLLIDRQLDAICALKGEGLLVKVNTILIPGINDRHIGAVARAIGSLGADIMNCIPIYPVEDTPFESIPPPPPDLVADVRAEAAEFMPQMRHCVRCRADAVGLLGQDMSEEMQRCLLDSAMGQGGADDEARPFVAVASMEGVLVNQHLGQAERMLIFEQDGEEAREVDSRPTPSPGGGDRRWEALAYTLSDCRALLVSGAGDSPIRVLGRNGLHVVVTEGTIQETVQAVFVGQRSFPPVRSGLGSAGCSGDSVGCG